MADKITPRAQDFSQWYQDIVLQAELADYSPVKGCMVIRPNGYSVWERIQSNLDARIKAVGVRNAYFPVLIPESFLKKEAEHVEGFAPQCAVVTYAGGKELEEKFVIRPTSETIINTMFAKWVQSYRDLPLLINQWANVMRWEMRTRLFLRTTEFLWQEGHTCHATLGEAEADARKMLGVYKKFSEEVLAMPVIAGRKSDSEKFAGALRTYGIEAMMQDGKALQAGTSHNLSDHFAKAFETKFLDKDGVQKHVFQTSWGVSTRLIGGLIMTHSDDKGFVLPPRLAETHVMMIPILAQEQHRVRVLEACDKLRGQILEHSNRCGLPYPVCVKIDQDESKQSGWKFHQADLLGFPIRIDIGPKDLEKNQAVVVIRATGEKQFLPLEEIPAKVGPLLAKIQNDLLSRATKFRDDRIFDFDKNGGSYGDFKKQLDESPGFYVLPWSQDLASESLVKEETKATTRCLVLDEDFQPVPASRPCLWTGKPAFKTIFARAY